MRLTYVLSILLLLSSPAFATFLPDNDLWKQDRILTIDQTTMTEAEFNQVIDKVYNVVEPAVKLHGGNLEVNRLWNDSTVNANSSQLGSKWVVNMYGGLARRPEITPDGFTVVMCHEMGHHLGGFPFVASLMGRWAASEGQADYYATDVCAKRVWGDDKVENAKSRFEVNPEAKNKCDAAYSDADQQNLCYRISQASHSLAMLLATLSNEHGSKIAEPKFETPDQEQVSSTIDGMGAYPSDQCRLDTYFHASLCTVTFDFSVIPGRGHLFQNGPTSEGEAAKYSCTSKNHPEGARPACWFKERI